MRRLSPFDVADIVVVGLYVVSLVLDVECACSLTCAVVGKVVGKGSDADGEVVELVVWDVDGEPGWTGDG